MLKNFLVENFDIRKKTQIFLVIKSQSAFFVSLSVVFPIFFRKSDAK